MLGNLLALGPEFDYVELVLMAIILSFVFKKLFAKKLAEKPTISIDQLMDLHHAELMELAQKHTKERGRGIVLFTVTSSPVSQCCKVSLGDNKICGFVEEKDFVKICKAVYKLEQLQQVAKMIRSYDVDKDFVLMLVVPKFPIYTQVVPFEVQESEEEKDQNHGDETNQESKKDK